MLYNSPKHNNGISSVAPVKSADSICSVSSGLSERFMPYLPVGVLPN